MKSQLQQLLGKILNDMGVTDMVPDVMLSEDPAHGEYSTNIAMILSKQMKKSPMDIALQVSGTVNSLQLTVNSNSGDLNNSKVGQKISDNLALINLLQAIERVEVVKPGFINIFLTEATLSTQIQEALKEKQAFGTGKSEILKRVTVEFTDPNPFKEFHIGHLYSNSVGESLSRLLESQGHTVRRVNYQGDVGMHVAKAIYGLLKDPSSIIDAEKLSLGERAKFLGAAYALGAKAFEESDETKKEIGQINKKIYDKDPAIYPLYTKTRQWSLDYFESIYARLGTKFEGYYFESVVGELGVKLVRDHVSDGIFEESDGAIIYRGEKKGLHTRVFINKLGLPTYEAKELGLAPTKQDDWPYDLSIIVTGNEINEYFRVLLAALADVAPELAVKTRHMGHGMVKKSDGSKMSSRSGMVLSGEGLLEEVKVSIYELLQKNKSNYDKVQQDEIAEYAAVAAVKYSLLRVSLPSDVAFDLQTSVSFDGDSGPYLLYTYARCRSVLKKASPLAPIGPQVPLGPLNPEEKAIVRMILFFPDVVAQAAADLSPNVICTYLFDLAQLFNGFYQKHSILGEPGRLALTAATAQVLKNGLYLLGIETVERM